MTYAGLLKSIGLSDKEARVYLGLLELGRTSAYAVAKKSEIKKATTYVILEQLIERGLAIRLPRTNKQLFEALPLDTAVTRAESKIKELKELLPKLAALGKKTDKVSAKYFENIDGLKQALLYGIEEMRNKEIVGFFAHKEKGIPEEIINFFDEFAGRQLANGITIRGVVPDHASLREYRANDKKYGREMHKVNFSKYSSSISIDVGKNFVRIIDPVGVQAIIIENEKVARALKEIFELVWTKY